MIRASTFLVEMTGLEPAASTSRTWRATNSATPGQFYYKQSRKSYQLRYISFPFCEGKDNKSINYNHYICKKFYCIKYFSSEWTQLDKIRLVA